MSDERQWKLTGVYGSPVALRLADGHGPQLPGPDEEIEVVEVAALARVERERDALRAQLDALTEAADDVLDERNGYPTDLNRAPRYEAAMDALAAARDAAAAKTPERAEPDLQAVIDRAYEAAHEFLDDPRQALVCVVEWLEPSVSSKAPDDPLR
jgi:cell division septum initiation protein DivIVA